MKRNENGLNDFNEYFFSVTRDEMHWVNWFLGGNGMCSAQVFLLLRFRASVLAADWFELENTTIIWWQRVAKCEWNIIQLEGRTIEIIQSIGFNVQLDLNFLEVSNLIF